MMLFIVDLGNRAATDSTFRIACVGDSITKGCGYPEKLRSLLGDGYTVGNFGVGGATVMVASGEPYIQKLAFKKAKAFLPDIIIIMLGTNDARLTSQPHIGEFTAEYKTLIAQLQEITSNPKIFIAKPPPIFNNTLGLDSTILMQDVIPRVEQVANELDLPLIDVYSSLISYPEYFVDGVHPSITGAEVIANVVGAEITSTSTEAAFVF